MAQRPIKFALATAAFATLAVGLQGCLAASVAGAGVSIAGAAVGTAA